MASAGSATVPVGGTDIYEPTGITAGCTEFKVGVTSGSGFPALINIPGLHDAGEFFPLVAGESIIFRLNPIGIRKVTVKGDGGDADITFGVVTKSV